MAIHQPTASISAENQPLACVRYEVCTVKCAGFIATARLLFSSCRAYIVPYLYTDSHSIVEANCMQLQCGQKSLSDKLVNLFCSIYNVCC